MIGRSIVGKGFYGCLKYNLEDKRGLTAAEKEHQQQLDGLQHTGRAEVLEYNMCWGDAAKLSRDFIELARENKRVERPVFHFTLRLAPGDALTKEQWAEVARECALEFNIQNNQYLVVLHKDTPQQHIHIVANRVGFDGKVASDSNNYRRMAALCRRMEQKFNLAHVQSPRAFLPKEQQQQPRLDHRKEKLRRDIARAIHQSPTYASFEQVMIAMGYQVIKGRGITFIDDKKVRTKGSDVGFSLSRIEKALGINSQLFPKLAELEQYQKTQESLAVMTRGMTAPQKMLWETAQRERYKLSHIYLLRKAVEALSRMVSQLCYHLFKPEYVSNSIDPGFFRKPKRKKKKRRL